MPNGHLEKIEISKRIFIVFLKMKTLDYTGVPEIGIKNNFISSHFWIKFLVILGHFFQNSSINFIYIFSLKSLA